MVKSKLGLLAAVATGVMAFAPSAFAGEAPQSFPFDAMPNARPGECYARILIPAQYRTVTEQVVLEEGYDRISVTDPRFAPQSQDVLVKDAASRYLVSEPVYQTVTEQVLVREGYETYEVVPAQYETVTETIQVRAPRVAWKPGGNLAGSQATRVDPDSGVVYCLVEIPGETKTVTRRVLVQPETTRAVAVPPQYATIEKQVLVKPAEVQEVPLPAAYKSMTVQTLAEAPRADRTTVPSKTGVVERKELVSEESYAWVSVLCDTNADADAISQIQRALADRRYYSGPIDGIIGAQTTEAIRRFQQDAGIPHSGYLSMETIDRLLGRTTSHLDAPARHADASQELLGGAAHVEVAQHEVTRDTVTWTQQAAPVASSAAPVAMAAPAPALDSLPASIGTAPAYAPSHHAMPSARVVRRHSVRSAHIAADTASLDSAPANVIIPLTGGGQGGGYAVSSVASVGEIDGLDGSGAAPAARVSRVLTWTDK